MKPQKKTFTYCGKGLPNLYTFTLLMVKVSLTTLVANKAGDEGLVMTTLLNSYSPLIM
ncbi:hypothetical protein [Paenibacillus aquistagni]|uniref:Uncharacterized protein n=1 Tax=Paenibacillus aquistagni TaxID=1852522 RepID=A0A1X7IT44_9BACL|nr:hypothetical protein [Paenibacillus aquistagni]SMG18044.1 hypothetical protein SAMN06295960_0759 [Paenibacillus aquistagni]